MFFSQCLENTASGTEDVRSESETVQNLGQTTKQEVKYRNIRQYLGTLVNNLELSGRKTSSSSSNHFTDTHQRGNFSPFVKPVDS
jgi:hypothetical protein